MNVGNLRNALTLTMQQAIQPGYQSVSQANAQHVQQVLTLSTSIATSPVQAYIHKVPKGCNGHGWCVCHI